MADEVKDRAIDGRPVVTWSNRDSLIERAAAIDRIRARARALACEALDAPALARRLAALRLEIPLIATRPAAE